MQFKAKCKEAEEIADSWDAEHTRREAAFQQRLSELKAAAAYQRDTTLSQAGISTYERADAKIVRKTDGSAQVYHGGIGSGDGSGHGHTALDSSGQVTYDRAAFAEHGRQNFVNNGTYSGALDGQPAVVKISDSENSNQMQVFYGGRDTPDGPGHSHINVVSDTLRYWRENGEALYRDDSKDQFNNL